MRILILGGTAWLGQAIVREADARGHEVTCLARGNSGDVPPAARFVRADRDRADAYDGVTAQRWDAVLDVSRQPGHVRRAVSALEPITQQYLFASSISVYASHREFGQNEDAPLLPPLESDALESMERYGEAKVACEQAVTAAFGAARTLVARASLIGGPGDWSGRSGYWPWRFARPSNRRGAVLVPDTPEVPAALIDVRDLAFWLVGCAETGTTGVFNVGGEPVRFADHIAAARAVAAHTGALVEAPSDWLVAQRVQSWSGPQSLPLWLDDPAWYAMFARDPNRARAAGLVTRPLERTLADTLAWELTRLQPGPHGAGLTDDEERRLLESLVGAAN